MNRSVRELHLMRYGATTSQLKRGLTDGPEEGPSAEEVRSMVDRLHKATPKHHQLAYDEGGGGAPPHSSYRSRQQRDGKATQNIPTLFPAYVEGPRTAASALLTHDGLRRSTNNKRRGGPAYQQQQQARRMLAQQAQPRHEDDNYSSIINKPIVAEDEVPTYPVDWRKNPSVPHSVAEGDEQLRWLYICFTLPLLPSYDSVTAEMIGAVDKLLRQHDVPVVTDGTRRKDVRNMLRDPRRYGLLIDVISTRRTVMAGTPHSAATAIYRHCEERYPIYVKFVFVGITDNGTKRVARDIFAGGRVPTYDLGHDEGGKGRRGGSRKGAPSAGGGGVPPSSGRLGGASVRHNSGSGSGAIGPRSSLTHSSSRLTAGAATVGSNGGSGQPSGLVTSSPARPPHPSAILTVSHAPGGGKALPFSAVDSVHCFIAHPKGDEADELRAKGSEEKARREAERLARRFTPKFVPPPPPDWMQRLLDAQERARTPTRREVAYVRYSDVSMPTQATTARLQQWGQRQEEEEEEAEMQRRQQQQRRGDGGGGGYPPLDATRLDFNHMGGAGGGADDVTLIEGANDGQQGHWLYGKAMGGASIADAMQSMQQHSHNLPSALGDGARPTAVSVVIGDGGGGEYHAAVPPSPQGAGSSNTNGGGGGISRSSEGRTVGAYLPPSPSPPRDATAVTTPSTHASKEKPYVDLDAPQTREQHYLVMAQRIAERLRKAGGGGGGGASASASPSPISAAGGVGRF